MSIRRLLAGVTTLVFSVILGAMFFLFSLYLTLNSLPEIIINIDEASINDRGSFLILVLTGWLALVVLWLILLLLHRSSFGMWIFGLRYDSPTLKRLIIRYSLGGLLDVLALPITFVFFLQNKETIGERIAGLSTIQDNIRGASMIVPFSVFLIIVGATGFFTWMLRQPYTVGALTHNTRIRAQLVEYAYRNPKLFDLFYEEVGLITSDEACVYSLYKKNKDGIRNYCQDALKETTLPPFAYKILLEWTFREEELEMLFDVVNALQKDTFLLDPAEKHRLYTLLERIIPQDNLGFREKQMLLQLKENLYQDLLGTTVSSKTLEQWHVEFIEYLVEEKQFEDVLLMLENLENIVDNEQELAWIYFKIGEVYFLQKQYKEAKKYFKKAISLDEGYQDKVKLYIR